jgi:hypothetical protein
MATVKVTRALVQQALRSTDWAAVEPRPISPPAGGVSLVVGTRVIGSKDACRAPGWPSAPGPDRPRDRGRLRQGRCELMTPGQATAA